MLLDDSVSHKHRLKIIQKAGDFEEGVVSALLNLSIVRHISRLVTRFIATSPV